MDNDCGGGASCDVNNSTLSDTEKVELLTPMSSDFVFTIYFCAAGFSYSGNS